MNIDALEQSIQKLVGNLDQDSFIYDLLLAYEQPKASITRLQKGDYNLSKKDGEVLWKKKLFFKADREADLHVLIDELQGDADLSRHHPRFLIVTDYQTLLAVDTKTDDTLDIEIAELPKHFDFFLPWAGMEKSQYQSENPADIKAAERMGRLYDLILENNPAESDAERHALNIFLSRLLFCYFAEDTGIFADDQFTNAVASHTEEDGSDLQAYLQKLFTVLNTKSRDDYPKFLQAFPYVNGGLFADEYPVPEFTPKSRKIIIECGALNWKEINPDIFGSMIQAVVHTDQRGSMGMHYTSVVNIMKVIEPLFLNSLHEELEKAEDREKRLVKLLERIYELQIFDPACGSGNFLIIAFKELCKLEIEIFKQLQAISDKWKTAKSGIRLTQFYGIELDDFAQETAKLSLWLAEHQMNIAFREVFGDSNPTLPLQEGGNIVCGNATRMSWEDVCPKGVRSEIYILGNPPYVGARKQSESQKSDLEHVFFGSTNFKNLDYIACWFFLGANYISGTNYQMAFVSTNSINQGQQVSLLWPRLFDLGLEIGFAHQSFKWTNNAKGNAGVTCVVVGLRNVDRKEKYIYNSGVSHKVNNINGYLIPADNIVVASRRKSLVDVPKMLAGNYTGHAQQLMLTDSEKEKLIERHPESERLIKRIVGSNEIIKGITRWCIWIRDEDKEFAETIPDIRERIHKVKNARESSRDKEANKLSVRPHQLRDINETTSNSIVVPIVSSENREYLPVAFIGNDTIVTNKAMVLYDCPPYIFAILSSKMHMVWVRAISGKLETRISYSNVICYNTFPFPELDESDKERLEAHVFNILDQRELYPEKSLAQLYDPNKMPNELRIAHHELDLEIDKCYRSRPFENDEKRLQNLFVLYEHMIESEGA